VVHVPVGLRGATDPESLRTRHTGPLPSATIGRAILLVSREKTLIVAPAKSTGYTRKG